jgi:hypothetical protein
MTHLNKNKRLTYRIIAILGLLMLSSCVTRIADLTLVSTKNIDLSDTQLDARKGQRQTGEDCRFFLLGFIPFGLPDLKEAVDEALEKGKGNIMVDEVTEVKDTWVVLGHIICYKVEGTVLNVPPPPSPSPKTVK